MTQTVVSFITGSTVVGGATIPVLQQRVFDFEISKSAQTFYQAIVDNLFNRMIDASQPVPTDIEAANFLSGLKELNKWSQMKYVDSSGNQVNGSYLDQTGIYTLINPNDTTTFTATTTMDRSMASALVNVNNLLSSVVKILKAQSPNDPTIVDFSDPNTFTVDQVQTALKVFQFMQTNSSAYSFTTSSGVTKTFIQDAFDKALIAAAQARVIGDAFSGVSARSLQQILMVDYVSRGNEILNAQMGGLKVAIDTNQKILTYINALQDLLNQKDPQRFVLQLQDLSATSQNTFSDSSSNYNQFETDTFNQTLGTVANPGSDANLPNYTNQNTQSGVAPMFKDAFKDPNNPPNSTYTKQMILTSLTNLVTSLQQATAGNSEGSSLITSLNAIKTDLSSLPADGSGNPIMQWIQDIQSGKEGDFQRHVSNAITTAQSFNDTQREKLREATFTYEEFYKSATSMLSTIGQLIQKSASNIGR